MIVVKDLGADFIYYDYDWESYVPYLGWNKNILTTSKSLTIPVSAYKDYQLIFITSPGLSVFQNHKLIYENTDNQTGHVFLPLADLVSGSSLDMFSFYQKDGLLPETVSIGYVGSLSEAPEQIPAKKRMSISMDELPFFMLIVILVTGVIIKQRYPKEVMWIMSPDSKGHGQMEEAVSSVNYLQWSFIIIVLMNSFCLVFSVALLESAPVKVKSMEMFLYCTMGVFILYYLKYIFFELMARIFNIGSIAKIHFREVIRISLVFNMIIVPIVSISYFSSFIEWQISYIGFLTILMIALLLGLLRLLVLTFRVPQFNYLYLFSYLCMAEIIPLAFVIKITLLSGLSL